MFPNKNATLISQTRDTPNLIEKCSSAEVPNDSSCRVSGKSRHYKQVLRSAAFSCGQPTPVQSAQEWSALSGTRDFDVAKKLIAEAGYKGEKIVVMDGVDQPVAHTQALVVGELLKKLGLNVEVQAVDWGTLVTRRASKEPIDKGGWNIFATGWVGADALDPVEELPLKTTGATAWFGWPSDDKLEALRAQWIKAKTLDERKKLAAAIQERAFEVVPYIPTGQWKPVTAYHKNLKGVIQAPAFLMWNVEKT